MAKDSKRKSIVIIMIINVLNAEVYGETYPRKCVTCPVSKNKRNKLTINSCVNDASDNVEITVETWFSARKEHGISVGSFTTHEIRNVKQLWVRVRVTSSALMRFSRWFLNEHHFW